MFIKTRYVVILAFVVVIAMVIEWKVIASTIEARIPGSHQLSPASYNPQGLINLVHTAVDQAVGTTIDDQIPGYAVRDEQITLNSGGLECPKDISNVKQALDILKIKLSSAFSDRIVSIRDNTFPPGDDTVLILKLRDGSAEVTVSITIFKRSNRVFLWLMRMSETPIK